MTGSDMPPVGPAPPGVSVIVPFYNAAATLEATLDSLVAQTYPDWEALLIDDGSDDAGPALAAARAARDPRFRLILSGGRHGVARARNLGIAAARGRLVALLDADDLWLPGKLAAQVPVLLAGAPLVFSAYARVDEAGRVLRHVPAPACLRHADMLAGNPIGCLTAIWDSAHFGTVVFPLLPMHEDYALWLHLLRGGACAVGLPQVLAHYRVRAGSHSARKWQAARTTWSILCAEPGVGLVRAAAGFARYALTSIARRI